MSAFYVMAEVKQPEGFPTVNGVAIFDGTVSVFWSKNGFSGKFCSKL